MAKRVALLTTMLLLFCSMTQAVILAEDPTANPPGDYEILASDQSRLVYSNGDLDPYLIAAGTDYPNYWRLLGPYDGSATNQDDGCLVMLFELPDRQGQLVDIQMLTFNYFGRYSQNRMENIDVYGLGYVSSTGAVDPSMYYFGPWWPWDDPCQPTPIMQGIITNADSDQVPTWRATDAEANLRLSCYINSLYDQGAVAGDYAAIRLNGSLRFDAYMRLDIYSIYEPFGRGPRIYYNLASSLPECPELPYPPRSCLDSPAGDLFPNFEGEDWVGGDCMVDLSDFAVMAAEWMRCDRIPQRLCD